MTTPQTDFSRMILRGHGIVTVNVLYYLPDTQSLLNEFMWQTLDVSPSYPRVHRFLNFWRAEIDAVIKEIMISDTGPAKSLTKRDWRNAIILDFH